MSDLLETPLFDLHQELGAKMVPFAGYSMPVQYGMGVMKEHVHTRTQAGLFDVSHMGQVVVSGEGHANHQSRCIGASPAQHSGERRWAGIDRYGDDGRGECKP